MHRQYRLLTRYYYKYNYYILFVFVFIHPYMLYHGRKGVFNSARYRIYTFPGVTCLVQVTTKTKNNCTM